MFRSVAGWLRRHDRSPVVVTLLVFLATFAAYLYYWGTVRDSVRKDMETSYRRQVRQVTSSAATRIQLYENFLRGGAGMFGVSYNLTQQDWTNYFEPYEITKNFPDIEAIGFSRYIARDQLPAFTEQMNEARPGYKIFPEGDRAVYTPVTFVATYTGNNGKSPGFDMYSNEARREAMDRAVEAGRPAASGQVELISETRPNRPAFLIYLPVYKDGMPIATTEQRKAAIYGFSYVAVDIRTMLADIEKENPNNSFGIQFFDLGSGDTPAYESASFAKVIKTKGSLVSDSQVELYGRKWKIVYAGSNGLIPAGERQLPDQALARGLFSSLFFALVVYYVVTFRERRLASQKHQEVQTAKDDLLSLASHQLRTPATVVKQYVGMLLQGYGGEISKQQEAMLSSAYESNERQLEIINQLLYVARLDAGRITLRKEPTDINKLLEGVIGDQKESVHERHQKLTRRFAKELALADVDPRYIRMVFENLLSNAIKYTPEGGTIMVLTKFKNDRVTISVKDTGVGISQHDATRVFDKFTRIENELSTDVNGSGVGLYLTKEIISLHGGDIEVVSEVGEGSTFTVMLPATPKETS